MDTPQLKLLAGLVRALLEQRDVTVSHAQSLEVVSALPGLRNWSEVQAFPDRVANCEMDAASTGRLSFRLRKKYNVEVSSDELLRALSPPATGAEGRATLPRIWPTGPSHGVYLATTTESIAALLAAYEDATDGEVVYAEEAGAGHDGAIELGEWGLSSNGLSRVPSGTLFVLGPVALNQQSWEDVANKLEWACIRASEGQRVAVLMKTPAPETLHHDVHLLVRDISPSSHWDHQLRGIVTADGELRTLEPFVSALPKPKSAVSGETRLCIQQESLRAISDDVLAVMRMALGGAKAGIAAFGTTYREEHHGVDLVAAALAMTDGLGLAARIKPRDRSTPAKDMMVPDAIKSLPFLPSIESAYALGFRRMVVNSGYTDAQLMLRYGDVLFLTGGYAGAVEDVFMQLTRHGGRYELHEQLVDRTLLAVGISRVSGKKQEHDVVDAYVKTPFDPSVLDGLTGGLRDDKGYEAVREHLRRARVLRWDDELGALLDQKAVAMKDIKAQLGRRFDVDDFLAARRSGTETAT